MTSAQSQSQPSRVAIEWRNGRSTNPKIMPRTTCSAGPKKTAVEAKGTM